MKLLVSFLIIYAAAPSFSAQGAETLSFEQIDTLIRTQNPVVDGMKNKKEAKRSREGHLKRSFLPDLNAEISQEVFKLGRDEQKNQSFWKVEANVNLYRGGADSLEEKARKMESKASEIETQVSTREELEKAYDLYWNLAFKQNHLQTLNEHLNLSQKNLREANRRVHSGVATNIDRLEFEMKISVIKQEMALVEKEIRGLAKILGDALGLPHAVSPKDSLQHFHDWEKNLQLVKASEFPEVKHFQNVKETMNIKRGQWKAGSSPSIDLYAGYSEPNQREERARETYAGVRASWSLGATINSWVERESLQKELRAKETQFSYLQKQVETSQVNRFDELKTLHSFVHDSEENIKISYKYLEATLKEYARGVKNSPDVLAATEKYISAKIRLAEIIRDFNQIYSSQLALRQP